MDCINKYVTENVSIFHSDINMLRYVVGIGIELKSRLCERFIQKDAMPTRAFPLANDPRYNIYRHFEMGLRSCYHSCYLFGFVGRIELKSFLHSTLSLSLTHWLCLRCLHYDMDDNLPAACCNILHVANIQFLCSCCCYLLHMFVTYYLFFFFLSPSNINWDLPTAINIKISQAIGWIR